MNTTDDVRLVHQIAERAANLYVELGIVEPKNRTFCKVGVAHEILTVHREVIPLRLAEFLAADDANFTHDVGGIHRHLDHGATVAKLTDCFLPRFAKV